HVALDHAEEGLGIVDGDTAFLGLFEIGVEQQLPLCGLESGAASAGMQTTEIVRADTQRRHGSKLVHTGEIQDGLDAGLGIEEQIRALEVAIAQTTRMPVGEFTPETFEHTRSEAAVGQYHPRIQAFGETVDEDG